MTELASGGCNRLGVRALVPPAADGYGCCGPPIRDVGEYGATDGLRGADGGGADSWGAMMTISTRRLRRRPSSVELSATGWYSA